MKFIFFFLLLGSQVGVSRDLSIESTVFLGESVPFLKFEGPAEFDNYLAMNLPFKPVEELFRQLNIRLRRPLLSRGEAHITVITPLEFWNILRPQGITMTEINQVAANFKIQNARFDILCLGQGTAKLEGKIESTFFIVVSSEDLLELRKQIQILFIRKGGSLAEFDPYNYYPHITVGYTKRDLHLHDGVAKDSKLCISQVRRS